MFARGGVADAAARSGRTTDITDLFRACLAALRVPEQVDAYQLRFRQLWRVPDAMARITQLLATRPAGGALASFLPAVDSAGAMVGSAVGRRWRAPSWERSNSHGAAQSRSVKRRCGKMFSSPVADSTASKLRRRALQSGEIADLRMKAGEVAIAVQVLNRMIREPNPSPCADAGRLILILSGDLI